jgi:DNA-binding transcriptional regulator YiaG
VCQSETDRFSPADHSNWSPTEPSRCLIGHNSTSYDTIDTIVKRLAVITGMQIRASRAALRWSAEVLAARAGVGVQTIKRLEAVDGVPPGRATTLQDVQSALEAAGIEFIGTPTDRPGIRVSATLTIAK